MDMDSLDKEKETRKINFLGTRKHMKRGLSFFKKGEYQHAIEQFELVLLHDKNYVRAYNNLGYVYRKLEDYDKALEIWEEGLKVDAAYKRLQKNVSSLQKFLNSKKEKVEAPPLGIEDFEVGVEWLSENAELIEIREGRFFDAYLIEDDGARYALKTPRRVLSIKHEMLPAFERACSDWVQLGRNEYVVYAHSLEWVADKPFLAMEYVPEGSLRSLLDNASAIRPAGDGPPRDTSGRGPLSLTQTLELAVQLCIGMHFIHAETGEPHGDIRPENLLLCKAVVTSAGQAIQARPSYRFLKIADIGQWAVFDRAKLYCDSEGSVFPGVAGEGLVRTPSGFLTTSVCSCAPELLESLRSPNVGTDVYAFGVVLYEMLTGTLPFSGSRPDEILREMSESRPKHPSVINTRVPPAVGNISMRCLEREPEGRFGNFFGIAEALIEYLRATRPALMELNELCKRYEKISRFQFRDEEQNASVMIVGGTEFSSEVGQLWEIIRHRAERERDTGLRERLANIENALLVPGLSMGEIFPTRASIANGLTLMPPEKYMDELKALTHAGKTAGMPGAGTAAGISVELPVGQAGAAGDMRAEVFGSHVAEKYCSLLRTGDSDRAALLLADALKSRANTFLPDSTGGPSLLTAFESVARSESFCSWLAAIFRELPSVSACPSPEDFLRNGMETRPEIVAAIFGMLLMMGGEFAAALEIFNMIPDERYLPALDIYLWAMAKFKAKQMEGIRHNSLKNASALLRENLIADKKLNERSTIALSTHPSGALSDAFFLRALVLEQLSQHNNAIAHFRAWKRLVHARSDRSQGALQWANLVQGKSMYDLGMPSEGFIRWQRVLTHELTPPFFAFLELGSDKPSVLLSNCVLQCCEGAISRFADNAVLWCVKGKLLNCVGRAEEALDCSHRAIAGKEGFYPAHFVRMEALLSMQKCEEALDALRVCVLREPYEPLFMLRETEILCKISEPEKALHELKRSIGHGLDLSELRSSIDRKRLSALEEFDDFREIAAHLDRA